MSFQGNGPLSRAEQDLTTAIKKATSADETAPKRKHVRACIVYTWDQRSGRAFWSALKLQPIQNDEVQLFKALVTIHKVLQEGHPAVLREAQNHVNWIHSLARVHGAGRGYGRLIDEYVRLLEKKLEFHRLHPDFNGTFEYEEYISLRTINDPNEGYEAIMDLMALQDAIDDFQRLVFASLSHGRRNECKISSLTGMIAESYGIFRFSTSMLRAMHQTANDDEALEPLRSRYRSQYHRLYEFYYDASSLKYLTSLISIPQLPRDPPDLYGDEESGPALPKRPTQTMSPAVTGAQSSQPSVRSTPSVVAGVGDAEPMGDWWGSAQQQQYEEQQRQLAAQQEAEMRRQQELALQQQRQFEEQQRLQEEQQRAAQEALMRDQMQRQAQGRVAELERDILNLRGQYDQSQLLLEQYDTRVKALETELQQLSENSTMQLQSKDDLIDALQRDIKDLRERYERLAKLYAPLQKEHTEMLSRFKNLKAKAASAQEAIDKREKLERDVKAKNLELADLIRERDRARYDLDKERGTHKEAIEKLEREIRVLNDKLDDAERSKGADFSLIISKHNRELAELEEALKAKQRLLDDFQSRGMRTDDETRQKDDEILILREELSSLEGALRDMSLQNNGQGPAGSVDAMLDSVLVSAAERIQEALFDFESPMQAGNQNSTPSFVLSVIEKASSAATDFSTAFNNFVVDPESAAHADIIKTAMLFSNAIAEVLNNAKGVSRLAPNDQMVDEISDRARASALSSSAFFDSLHSDVIRELTPEDKTELVIQGNVEVQQTLQELSQLAEQMSPKVGALNNASGDLGNVVDNELAKVADAIALANSKLTSLLARPRDPKFSTFDVQVNEAILAAAIAVTSAIAALIKAATDCQQEIVAQGRGSSSRTAYYKKHNRWTEGLISAARAVAGATNILIETADGTLSGNNSPEQLIVASNEVASSTAQLVAASRVKATFMSKTQERLETASKSVSSAVRSLVSKVQAILAERESGGAQRIDFDNMSVHEFRTASMEQQVEVLKLEQALTSARNRLFDMRKNEYRFQDDDDDA